MTTHYLIAFTFHTLAALALMGSQCLLIPSAQANPTANNPSKPLIVSEGNAKDLSGTLAKDASLWLEGVGGGETDLIGDDSPYHLSSQQNPQSEQSLNSLEPHNSQKNSGSVQIKPLPISQF